MKQRVLIEVEWEDYIYLKQTDEKISTIARNLIHEYCNRNPTKVTDEERIKKEQEQIEQKIQELKLESTIKQEQLAKIEKEKIEIKEKEIIELEQIEKELHTCSNCKNSYENFTIENSLGRLCKSCFLSNEHSELAKSIIRCER
jgi:hypothetical protein